MSLTQSDYKTFEHLKIPPELLEAAGVVRVTDQEARQDFGIIGSGDMSGIIFPYHDPIHGQRWTARIRRDRPEMESGKPRNKYISAYGDRRHLYFPPGLNGTLNDGTVPVVLVEAEKSALALLAWSGRTQRKIVPVAMGGCWGWRGRIGKVENSKGERVDEVGALPDLLVASGGRKVYVLLDANTATNPKVQQAQTNLVRQLRRQGAEPWICTLPNKEGVNGPDDYIGHAGDDAMARVLDNPRQERRLKVTSLSDIKAKQQEWLWIGYIPIDQLIALYGPSHTAKSIICIDCAARVTTGANWPDGSPNLLGSRKVLMLSAGEDALETVLKPRFALAGGDASKLRLIQGSIISGADSTIEDELLALDQDTDLLEAYLSEEPDIALIIIDPVTNHLGKSKLNLDEEIRPILMRLKSIAERHRIPIVIVGHFNRREKGTAAFDRMLGSRAFSAVPRTIFMTGADNEVTEKHNFVMVQARGLGANAWKYRTEKQGIEVDGEACEQIKLLWGTQAEITGEDVVNPLTIEEKSKDQGAADELVAYLKQRGGSAPKADCIQHLWKLNYANINEQRVRRRAGVESRQDSGNSGKFSGATWALKPSDTSESPCVPVSMCLTAKRSTLSSSSTVTYPVRQAVRQIPSDTGTHGDVLRLKAADVQQDSDADTSFNPDEFTDWETGVKKAKK